MENLDRGVVAVKVSGGVYVGWRMFGYEYTGTDSDTSYNLYKDGAKLANVTDSTNYLDAAGTTSSKYTVSAVIKGTEGPQSTAVMAWGQQYTSIPLTKPASQYNANDAAAGDLDGDGKLDIVLKWEGSTKDNSNQASLTPSISLDTRWLASSSGCSTWVPTFALGRTTRRCRWATSTATARRNSLARPHLGPRTEPARI